MTLDAVKQRQCCIIYAGISKVCFKEIQWNAVGLCQVKRLKEMMFGGHYREQVGD